MTGIPYIYKLDKKFGVEIDQYGYTKEENEMFKNMSFDTKLGSEYDRMVAIQAKMIEIRKKRPFQPNPRDSAMAMFGR